MLDLKLVSGLAMTLAGLWLISGKLADIFSGYTIQAYNCLGFYFISCFNFCFRPIKYCACR